MRLLVNLNITKAKLGPHPKNNTNQRRSITVSLTTQLPLRLHRDPPTAIIKITSKVEIKMKTDYIQEIKLDKRT